MKKNLKNVLLAIGAVGVLVLLFFVFRPAPLDVDVARVQRGPLQETLEQEGKTRMHDHFVLASTVSGRLKRIEIHAGDPVSAEQVIASVDLLPLDPQQRVALEARLSAAEESQREATARVQQAEAQASQTKSDLERANKLGEQGVISRDALEKSQTAAKAASKELEAALFRSKAARYQVEEAKAALLATAENTPAGARTVSIHSPVAGRVLRLIEQSERVVSAGTPLVELGYTPKLEIVADFLTTDAVKISPGMQARIENWGGGAPIPAQVRVVEPLAFTKISALGVEEQRVNVVLDFLSESHSLGDAYRVEVRVITWQSSAVVQAPLSAFFRRGEEWNVFVAQGGKAMRRAVKIGHRSDLQAEVLDGLKEGESVITHPSNQLAEGKMIRVHQPQQN
ncbi:MAG: efflux RND transporter periplasmic adaptor subunit [Acidobacteriia bacterium]|nr:efflux RND transporter periplasmic adaptor subunit [Terriglobia bacterium]